MSNATNPLKDNLIGTTGVVKKYSALKESTERAYNDVAVLKHLIVKQLDQRSNHPEHPELEIKMTAKLEEAERAAFYLKHWAEALYENQRESISDTEFKEARILSSDGYDAIFLLQDMREAAASPGMPFHLFYAMAKEIANVYKSFTKIYYELNLVKKHDG